MIFDQPPAIIQPGELWEKKLGREMERSGVPLSRRLSVISEIKRVFRLQQGEVVRPTLEDLAKYAGLPIGAFIPGMTAAQLNGFLPSGFTVQQISRSLRFNNVNSAGTLQDSAFLNFTPGSSASRDLWVLSVWLKRSTRGTTQTILSADTTSDDRIHFTTANKLNIDIAGTTRLLSTRTWVASNAWGHLLIFFDAANGTAANRLRVYWNGVEITAWDTDARSGITTGTAKICHNVVHNIGRLANGSSNFFDGYMADIKLVAGQTTTPASFAATNPVTAQWDPIAYAGSYGTNGWWLSFHDNASTTTLGRDDAGGAAGGAAGSNDWTLNNFSVAAGVGNDSLTDTPTNFGSDTMAGGEVRGNYAILDRTDFTIESSSSHCPVSQGGLVFTSSSTISQFAVIRQVGIRPPTTVLFYFEFTVDAVGSDASSQGITVGDINYNQAGTTNGGNAYGSAWGAGNVIGVAISSTGVWFRIGTTWQNGATLSEVEAQTDTNAAGNPDGANPTTPVTILCGDGNANVDSFTSITLNFGQRPYANAAPSGYKSFCSHNLPDGDSQKYARAA